MWKNCRLKFYRVVGCPTRWHALLFTHVAHIPSSKKLPISLNGHFRYPLLYIPSYFRHLWLVDMCFFFFVWSLSRIKYSLHILLWPTIIMASFSKLLTSRTACVVTVYVRTHICKFVQHYFTCRFTYISTLFCFEYCTYCATVQALVNSRMDEIDKDARDTELTVHLKQLDRAVEKTQIER